MIVCFVDIGLIDDLNCLSFLFIIVFPFVLFLLALALSVLLLPIVNYRHGKISNEYHTFEMYDAFLKTSGLS